MNIKNKEPNMADMKRSIVKAGGLFYQYRPCRRNSSTIYDIENIIKIRTGEEGYNALHDSEEWEKS